MYTGFFGLNQIPFSIAPNPSFLFMGERHGEALAHLQFGLGETGGFVLLTGEVGTGKTTLCRRMLEQLPETVEVAFILNPTLSERELLASICDELKIRYLKTKATIKDLTDKITGRLLKNHEKGIKTVLIIDEAQHLRPEVLEQLRLLTNLETDSDKLLKVIIIGQPELQQLLKRQELRQLAQRITARYHLLPLTEQEVSHYIHHRLQVAGCERQLFTRKAIKQIHQLSNGIPRLINLLCDRALLGAFAQRAPVVDHKIAIRAAKETLDPDASATTSSWIFGATLAGAFALSGLAGWWISTGWFRTASDVVQMEQATQYAETPNVALARSLEQAAAQLYSVWGVNSSDIVTGCEDQSLSCFWFNGSFGKLVKLDLPALLRFSDQDGSYFYGVVKGQVQDKLLINIGGLDTQLTRGWLDQHWQGQALVFWQSPQESVFSIGKSSSLTQVQWLDNLLSMYHGQAPRVISSFDEKLENKLNVVQRKLGLEQTNVASPFLQLAITRKLHADWPSLEGF